MIKIGRVRDTDTRRRDKHKFITESIYHAGALALVCQFAVWYKNCARAGGPGTEHVNNNNNNLSVNFFES